MTSSETYTLGMYFTGAVTFLGIWLYALGEWGFLFGLIFGWFPAMIGATIVGILWPLVVVLLLLGLMVG